MGKAVGTRGWHIGLGQTAGELRVSLSLYIAQRNLTGGPGIDLGVESWAQIEKTMKNPSMMTTGGCSGTETWAALPLETRKATVK